MSFTFNTKGEQDSNYTHDPETECIVYVGMNIGPTGHASYDGTCGGCQEPIDVNDSVTKCPGCDRHIIDWEGK